MKLCKLEELKVGDRLARAVLASDYQVLLASRTILTKEYIDKLVEFKVEEVYVFDDNLTIDKETVMVARQEVGSAYHQKVKNIMEKHVYSRTKKLQELAVTADEIIMNVLEEDDVVGHVYEIRERSADIYEHSISICVLAVLVALQMRMDKQTIHDISIACLLHDIGLRYMFFDYTSRHLTEYNAVELAEYYKHPIYGYTSLQGESWITNNGKLIILHHHEHIDGSGFPLKMKESPLAAQIVTICDAFDEMICGIAQEPKKTHEATAHLRKYRGTKYNEMIVNILLEFLASYPIGTIVVTSDLGTGIVIGQNRGYPDRPIIRLIKDNNGDVISGDEVVDMKKSDSYIKNVLE
ncbi:MAG: HD domain-containing protein [Lachnospiraceae bacterium]|jgi:HD-GYP domain-containing protein (c-di-GMP phosphodiesterase class II)|nr:HD domain-containing protein [Lachnospiraceae bacterium]